GWPSANFTPPATSRRSSAASSRWALSCRKTCSVSGSCHQREKSKRRLAAERRSARFCEPRLNGLTGNSEHVGRKLTAVFGPVRGHGDHVRAGLDVLQLAADAQAPRNRPAHEHPLRQRSVTDAGGSPARRPAQGFLGAHGPIV